MRYHTSGMAAGYFGRPDRDNRIEMTGTDTGDDASADEHIVVDRSRLKGPADDTPTGACEDDFDPSEAV